MDLPDVQPEPRTQHICIIGGGGAGLACLKLIKETAQYQSGLWFPSLFEERDKAGGIWVPAPPTSDPPLTPLYDSLTTNLPHIVMSYTDFSFPPETPVFPKASIVEQYFQDYVRHFDLASHIHLHARVDSVVRSESESWTVTLASGEKQDFDLVLACNGHYRKPRTPNIPGLSEWISSKKAMHSVFYRRPEPLFGSVLLVIGGGPSGQDITSDASHVISTVIHSVTGTTSSQIGNLKLRGRVTSFGPNGTVTFEDGTTESGIDFCVLATGYEFSFPFLSSSVIQPSTPPSIPPLPENVHNSTYNLFPLARHISPMQNSFPPSTLAFIGLPIRVPPLPLMEAQIKAALRVFANPDAFNYTEEAVDIMTRYEDLKARFNTDDAFIIAKQWHRMEPTENFQYRDMLCRFAEVEMPFKRTRVQDWEIEMYLKKDVLRKVWVQLEREGKADAFVKGVGNGGLDEWVELLRKMLQMAEATGMTLEESEMTKL